MTPNYIKDIMSSSMYGGPLEHIRGMSMSELQILKEQVDKEFDRRTMDTPLLGPTKRELLGDVTLKEAWNELQTIRRLKGI